MPSPTATSLQVDDDVSLKCLGKLAAAIASCDIRKRWETSLETLKACNGSPTALRRAAIRRPDK
jgi:hypothetical protein